MTLPKILKLVFITGLFLYFGFSIFHHQSLSFGINDLVLMEKSGFSKVCISSSKRCYEIEKAEIKIIMDGIERMEKLPWLHWNGWRGEEWIQFCSVNFTVGSNSDLFRVNLATRESLDGRVLANLQRVTGNSTYYYDNYIGNDLVAIINALPHNKSFKDGRRIICGAL